MGPLSGLILQAREAEPSVRLVAHAHLLEMLEALCELRPVIVARRHGTLQVFASRPIPCACPRQRLWLICCVSSRRRSRRPRGEAISRSEPRGMAG
jgi:hypothetical protein